MAQHLLSVDATARICECFETAYGPQCRGTTGSSRSLYFSGVYLGDDPDPNIRFQILRDITGRFGGDSN